MGRKILWIGAAAGLLAVCAGMMMQQERVPEGEFRIEGELTGVPDSTVLSLYRVDGNLLKPMQADTVIDGRFSFRDTITTDPRCLALMGRGEGFPPTWLDVWVGSGTVVHIKGEGKGLRTWFVESRLPEQEEQSRLSDAVRDWYRTEWWDRLGLGSLPQALANEIFEQAVNLGKGGAGRLLQRVINAFNWDKAHKRPLFPDLVVDGAIGPRTLDGLALLLRSRTSEAPLSMLSTVCRAHTTSISRRANPRNVGSQTAG